jgi:hypothetical protein
MRYGGRKLTKRGGMAQLAKRQGRIWNLPRPSAWPLELRFTFIMPAYTDLARQLQRTNPELYDLPHPKAARIIGVVPLLSHVLGENGLFILSDLFKDLTKTKGRIVAEGAAVFPSLNKLKELSAFPDGRINLAGLDGFLSPLRFFANEGRIFQVEKRLDELLAVTDIGSTAPIEYFRLPFRTVYFHFGANGGGLQIHARTVGTSPLLGCYATELNLTEETPETKPFLQWAGPNGELSCFEVTFVSRPIRSIADHGFSFMRLYVGLKMEGMTVEEVLRLNFEVYEQQGCSQATPEEREQLIQGVTHLAKVLLQINVEGTELKEDRGESTLAARLKAVGSKKQAKLERRLERTYDHILITHDFTRTHRSEGQGVRTVRGHWRRGHFRHQPHGPGRTLIKLKWIFPMWVGEAPQEGESASKEYAVRASDR